MTETRAVETAIVEQKRLNTAGEILAETKEARPFPEQVSGSGARRGGRP